MGLDTATVFPFQRSAPQSPRTWSDSRRMVSDAVGQRAGCRLGYHQNRREPAPRSGSRVSSSDQSLTVHEFPDSGGRSSLPVIRVGGGRVTAILVSADLSPALYRHSSCIRKMLRLAG